MYGKYLYGIISGGGDTVLGVKELVGDSLVHNIAYKGLSCVASDYTGGNLDVLPKEELARHLVMHQRVVEQVVKRHPILPLKFGTVLADSNEVRQLLAQGHPQFSLTLFWMQDKVEVEVMATCASGQIFEENALGPETLLLIDEALPPEQIKLSPPERRRGYLERMVGFLKSVSVDIQPRLIDRGGMAVSAAFLVEEANLEMFHDRVKHLNALFYNQIDFQLTGPLPPYSFAMVEVNRPDPEAMDEAKRLLKLSEVNDEAEVRKAYRRALESGSGSKVGGKLARARLMALRRASDLLVAYCRRQAEKGGGFLISIRRSRSDEVQLSHPLEIGA